MAAIKLNISLDRATADKLKRRAHESGKPASRYIAALIDEDDRRAQDELAAEGYRLLSEDSRELEAAAWTIAAEGWPAWEEAERDGHDAQKG